jgi:lon-related putative ATP-dependent protease
MARKQKRSKISRARTVRADIRRYEVPVKKLRWQCRPEDLGISRIEDARPISKIIGQDRALRALRVGLEMTQYGYNIFATGVSGTGRTTTIKRLLKEYESHPTQLTDKCFVHNFHDPDSSMLIVLPAGKGLLFKKDMETFLAELLKGIPAAFESRRYQEQRKALLEHFQDRQRSVLKDFEKRVKQRGFEVVQVQSGPGMRPEIVPVTDGNPVNIDQLQAKVDAGEMAQEELNKITAQQAELEGQMDLVMREMRNIERKAKHSLEGLSHKIVVPLVEELIDDLESKYISAEVRKYLAQVKKDVLEHLPRFHQKDEGQTSVLGLPVQKEEDPFIEYKVNVVVDNGDVKGRPVIIETNPRYKNLFGTIDRVVDKNGVWRSDFTLIKAGSILKADGGFLVINALDALVEPGVWTTLKRILRNRQIEIQPMEFGLLGASSALKPEPVRINVKVVMVGDSYVYHLLYGFDDDFKEVFKIRADFDTEMPNEQKSIDSYVSFIKTLCEDEHLLLFDLDGIIEVVEYGVRLSGQQNKLSTRFNILADVIREASYWAQKEEAQRVTVGHVRKAIDERIERVKLLEEKIQELITDGTIMIDTDGAVVGQVNGLSVYEIADFMFGKPTRITATTALGRSGIINIEREALLSGPTHDKGVFILSGYLRNKYARHKPLVLSASIAFEQSYSGVDGDSASSTEVYAILSSLAGIPLRQDIAVTGSVNQNGDIQAIGGVNMKIEGFFDVCKARGLTGTQGVLVPEQNVKDLMLRHDIVEVVRKKKFHIYAIKSIDQGLEILAGAPAGKLRANQKFTAGSVHAKVDDRLVEYAKQMKKLI